MPRPERDRVLQGFDAFHNSLALANLRDPYQRKGWQLARNWSKRQMQPADRVLLHTVFTGEEAVVR